MADSVYGEITKRIAPDGRLYTCGAISYRFDLGLIGFFKIDLIYMTEFLQNKIITTVLPH